MRKGAQGLAQQMQQNGIGMGPGPGQPGRNGRARAQTRIPIRSGGRCTAATTATTSR